VAQFRGVELSELELSSPRLLLRPWRSEDVPAITAALRTAQMHTFLALPDPYTEADAAAFVSDIGPAERAAGTGLDCAVVERRTGCLVGSATLRLPAGTRGADIGYWIAPDAQGNGYAAEATGALAEWAFAHEVYRVELRLDVTNIASAQVALAAGFAFEGLRRDFLRVDDGRRDLAVFVRTADDSGARIAPAYPALPAEGLSDGTLLLRDLLPGDYPAFAEQESDPVTLLVGFTGTTPPERAMRRVLASARLDRLVGTVLGCAMVDVGSGRYAGAIRIRVAGPPNVGGIGYAVHPAFRGRGFTTRALRLSAAWAFEHGGFARLELGAKVDNVASQRAALAAGFRPEGIFPGRLRNIDGTFSDEARFALLAPPRVP
jgi:RimJ/RimL family protein N-acetyltransferase